MLQSGGLFGQISGGILGQYLYNYRKSSQCYLMGISTILSAPPMLYLLNTSEPGSVGFYIAAAFSGLVVRYVLYIYVCVYGIYELIYSTTSIACIF